MQKIEVSLLMTPIWCNCPDFEYSCEIAMHKVVQLTGPTSSMFVTMCRGAIVFDNSFPSLNYFKPFRFDIESNEIDFCYVRLGQLDCYMFRKVWSRSPTWCCSCYQCDWLPGMAHSRCWHDNPDPFNITNTKKMHLKFVLKQFYFWLSCSCHQWVWLTPWLGSSSVLTTLTFLTCLTSKY